MLIDSDAPCHAIYSLCAKLATTLKQPARLFLNARPFLNGINSVLVTVFIEFQGFSPPSGNPGNYLEEGKNTY
jgi:hypothetical protein